MLRDQQTQWLSDYKTQPSRKHFMKRFASCCLTVTLAACTFNFASLAQAGPAKHIPQPNVQSATADAEPQDPQTQPQGPTGQDNPFRRDTPPEIRSYDRVITKDAKSDAGIFTVHRLKEKVYYEIPKSELGKDFLWVSQIAQTTLGVGYGGQAAGRHVVRWERHANRVLLRGVSYDVVADPKLPVSRAVHAANNNPIIMSFWIEAFGKDEAPVIDVTRLFTTEVTEFSARARLRARAFDATRSFIERIVFAAGYDNTCRTAAATQSLPGDRNAHGQRHRRDALQHGQTPGAADDATLVR